MEALELALIMVLQGFLCISSFSIGAKVGQKVVKGEAIETGIKNPIQAFEEYKEKETQKRIEDRHQTVAENIDNYDGTGLGQKDLPSV